MLPLSEQKEGIQLHEYLPLSGAYLADALTVSQKKTSVISEENGKFGSSMYLCLPFCCQTGRGTNAHNNPI